MKHPPRLRKRTHRLDKGVMIGQNFWDVGGVGEGEAEIEDCAR